MASSLIANVYPHYLFDLWADVWRKKVAQGDVIVVRYADDPVVGFQHRTDAERFLKEFREPTESDYEVREGQKQTRRTPTNAGSRLKRWMLWEGAV